MARLRLALRAVGVVAIATLAAVSRDPEVVAAAIAAIGVLAGAAATRKRGP